MRTMSQIAAKIVPYQVSRATGLPSPMPSNYTFSISTRCNSRCLTCNIWKKRENDLTLDEWEKVFISLGDSPYWATISGGEPFLQKHIVTMAELLARHCAPAIINIPTNGILPFVAERAGMIAEKVFPTKLIINISLDGVGERHDEIRGVPGNFKRFEQTLANLIQQKERHENLSIGIHTVVSAFNQTEIAQIQEYAFRQQIDQYISEMAEQRVELDTMGLPISPDPEYYSSVLDTLINGLSAKSFQNVSRMTRAFRLEYYRLVKKILQEKKQVIPCFAGWISTQIYSDGTVWPCCVRADPLGSLRDVDYDFAKIWNNQETKRVRRSIAAGECWCPLANAAYTNMLVNPTILARIGTRMARESLSRPSHSQ